MTKTATAKAENYKQGDYLASDRHVFHEIVGVLEGVMPLYAVVTPKHNHVQWYSKFELDELNLVPKQPDFAAFAKVQAGDVIKLGFTDEAQFVRILARVGDVVLLSRSPDPKTVKQVTDLSKQLEELTDGMINPMEMLGADEKTALRKMGSTTHASKVAAEWYGVRELALMNWQLIGE